MEAKPSDVNYELDPHELKNPILAALKAYWDSKRGSRAMPSRADIRPAEMKEQLTWVVLRDVLPGYTDFRYRTVGTQVAQQFAHDSTGQLMSETLAPFGPDVVAKMLNLNRESAQKKLPVRIYGNAAMFGFPFLDFDSILLPLSDDGVTANMILEAVVFGPAKRSERNSEVE